MDASTEPRSANPAPVIPTAPNDKRPVSDDAAYILPMFVFLLFTYVGSTWPATYPIVYTAKTIVVAGLLIWLWPSYTRVRWHFWWLGLLAGIIGILQWVPMQLWLQANVPLFKPPPVDQLYNPFEKIQPTGLAWAFVAVRIIGAVILVPIMEELFWRDYLWRRIVAPNDFKLAHIGERDWTAFVLVAIFFATVHGNWWLTAIIWGLMIGALLLYTKSLGACMIMHATTNALLAAYVLYTNDWAFW